MVKFPPHRLESRQLSKDGPPISLKCAASKGRKIIFKDDVTRSQTPDLDELIFVTSRPDILHALTAPRCSASPAPSRSIGLAPPPNTPNSSEDSNNSPREDVPSSKYGFYMPMHEMEEICQKGERCEAQEEQIQSLTEQIAQKCNRIKQKDEEIRKFTREIDSFAGNDKALLGVENAYYETTCALKNTRKELQEAKDSLESFYKELTDTKYKLNVKEDELTLANRNLQDALMQVAEAKDARYTADMHRDSAQRAFAGAEAKSMTCTTKAALNAEMISTKLQQKEIELDAAKTKLQEEQNASQVISAMLLQRVNENEILQNKLKRQEEDCATSQKDLIDVQKLVQDANEKLQQKEKHFDSLQKDMSTKEARFDYCLSQFKSLKTQAKSADHKLRNKKQDLESLQKKFDAKQQDLESLQKDFDSLQNEFDTISIEGAKQYIDLKQIHDSKTEEAKARFKTLENQYNEQVARYMRQSQMLSDVSKDKGKLEDQYMDDCEIFFHVELESERVSKELDEYRVQRDEFKQKYEFASDKLAICVAQSKAEFERVTTELVSTQEQRDQYRKQLAVANAELGKRNVESNSLFEECMANILN